MRMRRVFGIEDEKSAGALAEPLDEAGIAGALVERLDAVKRVLDAAAFAFARLRPFVDHGGREREVGGNFLGRFLLQDFAKQFVRFHGVTMPSSEILASRKRFRISCEII